MHLESGQITELVARQISTLAGVASQQGIRLQHVKAHGALYNTAVADRRVADAIARGVAAVDPSLILLGLPGSELVLAGIAAGLATAGEAFADRAYRPDGTLVPRSEPGAVLHEPAEVLARIVSLASRPGVDTICVHGDTPGAAELAANVRATLEAASFVVKSLSSPRLGDERSP